MNEVINKIATDYCCDYQIKDNIVVFDSSEISLDDVLSYGVNARQYFPSMVDDDWIVDYMEQQLIRPNNNEYWTDEDFDKVLVVTII